MEGRAEQGENRGEDVHGRNLAADGESRGMWHDLIHLGLPWWDKALRTIAVYLGLLALLRLAGKRQLAQLTTLDLVVLLLLSNVVQNAIIGNETSLPGGLLGAAILIAANWVLVRISFRQHWLSWLLNGSPTTLYENGHVDERNLVREQMTRQELVSALRREGMELDDVESVALEPEGTFNAQPKPKPDLDDVMAALHRIEQRLG
jgi:uncharacterized membrane protein YcaP (DUF421 family)